MIKLSVIIKIVLFIVSSLGYWELLSRKLRINQYFLPSLTIAIQTSILFMAGLLNCLKETAAVLWIFGILLSVFYVYKDKGISCLKKYASVGYLFLYISLLALFLFLRGKIYAHWDNFTHWGLVVRTILETNRFPSFKDTLILFPEYPLGSAIYIYYFAKLTRSTESFQMLAQCFMMLSCIMPVFSVCKKNKAAGTIAVFGFTNFFLVYNVVITNLLVDTLLPLAACCAFFYMFEYCRTMENKKAFYAFFFYLIQIVQIKNSGMLFVVVAIIWIIMQGTKTGTCLIRAIGGLFPLLSFFLWHKHCSYVFEKAETSAHAMTIANYKRILGSKDAESIISISKQVVKYVITSKEAWITYALLLILLLLIWVFNRKMVPEAVRLIRLSAILYFLYCIGMWLMYIFSMPASEASHVAGIERYLRTILIVLVYTALVLCIRMLSESNPKSIQTFLVTGSMIAVLALQLFATYGKVRTVFEFYGTPMDKRRWLETQKELFHVPNGDSYCILLWKDDGGYTYYLSRYIFRSSNINVKVINEKADLDEIQEHYIFNYDWEKELISEWQTENYPDQAGNLVIVLDN